MKTLDELKAVYHLPLTELVFRAGQVHREHHDCRDIQALRPPEHQDRRLPRRLRLLLPERPLLHGRGSDPFDECRGSPATCPASEGTGRHPFLHGGGLAKSAQRAAIRPGPRNGAGGARTGHGSVRHPRHVDRRASGAAARGGADGVQPQSRYVAPALRSDRHHARATTTGWQPCGRCSGPASRSAAAASWA